MSVLIYNLRNIGVVVVFVVVYLLKIQQKYKALKRNKIQFLWILKKSMRSIVYAENSYFKTTG